MASKTTTVAGTVGSVLFAGGAFPAILRLIDQISRLQTVVSLKPYMDVFSTPVSIGCLILGPCLVWYAISSEHKKDIAEAKRTEEESGPRIWTPGCGWRPDESPPPLPLPPVNYRWLITLMVLGALSVTIAVGFAFLHHQKPSVKSAAISPAPETRAASPAPPQPSTKNAPGKYKPPSRTTARKEEPAIKASPTKEQQAPSLPVAPAQDAHIAESVPSNLIPKDPLKAIEVVQSMTRAIKEVIRNKKYITFLVSFPKDDNTYLVTVDSLLATACIDVPRQCYFAQEEGPGNLDKPHTRINQKRPHYSRVRCARSRTCIGKMVRNLQHFTDTC